ncbi:MULTISPECIES: FkbM family methyltransferase [unclassified Azospirillum]|uniref:FkbM family methyltransferase n=1 Tax=unclassified Azospirillum TaxID=2630922 RepID=UPI000B63D177|nr:MULTISPECIES: FkbM family methyltransferase [unclassified Azospirillum]SNS40625.1 methyltransferase, FkbM family [Azospirillum sp. RU38E]SNS59190.1 methyltransferase, FkbM family [Azospirillum sp. RU37A]
MRAGTLEALWYAGYGPRTLLDVGAHMGAFTASFMQVFPHVQPVLVEPNPHCQEALAQLPFERHAVAAAAENGERELFLTSEWLQSTGTSLYRENTAFFRDEVVVKHPVQAVRLDDLFAGRRFDFVKIDVQGAELEVLQGGQHLIRQADYVLLEVSLVEYNLGGALAEQIFAAMAELGFRCADALEFHRLQGTFDGNLLQIDFLFERGVRRPSQTHRYAAMHDHGPLLAHLAALKARHPDFTVIDVGAAANPWSAPVLDATLDFNACAAAPLNFHGNINDPRAWEPVLSHVARHGRFSFCICSHTLEDLAYPAVALEMMPRIAEAGYIAVPSRYVELVRPEGPWRGYIHHRWILDMVDHRLVIAPKLPIWEYLPIEKETEWAADPSRFELQMTWRGGINFTPLNGDYMGPSSAAVIQMMSNFGNRA